MLYFIYLLILINYLNLKFSFSFLSDEKIIKYLEFDFERNLTLNETMNSSLILKELFYNQIYINLKIGSNKKTIPFYIYLQQFPLIIQSSNVDNNQVKGLYNETISETFELIKVQYFFSGDMKKGILSKDNFYINDNIIPFKFYLSKENIFESHINEGGKIGFKLYPTQLQSKEPSFIQILKNTNIISSNIFLFKYNSNEKDDNKGKLIIGAYPHLINHNIYNEKYYIKDNANKGYSDIDWLFDFDEIKIGDEIIKKEKKAYFYNEIGFIIAPKIFFDNINNLQSWKQYFLNNSKCHITKFTIDDFEIKEVQQKIKGEYTSYYCEKDVNIENINISDINFVKKNMNFTFNIKNSDIWIKKGNYNYLMIIQKQLYNDIWILGKPFFKKYNLIFEYDSKQIGLYTQTFNENNTKNQNNFIYILIIIGLIIIIILLIIVLYKCYMILPRKKRANEMNDDFEYIENLINNK